MDNNNNTKRKPRTKRGGGKEATKSEGGSGNQSSSVSSCFGGHFLIRQGLVEFNGVQLSDDMFRQMKTPPKQLVNK